MAAGIAAEGKLTAATARFWGEKPTEELYDMHADPDNVHNLARTAAHRSTLDRMRARLRQRMVEIQDNGLLPEGPLWKATMPHACPEPGRSNECWILRPRLGARRREPAEVHRGLRRRQPAYVVGRARLRSPARKERARRGRVASKVE